MKSTKIVHQFATCLLVLSLTISAQQPPRAQSPQPAVPARPPVAGVPGAPNGGSLQAILMIVAVSATTAIVTESIKHVSNYLSGLPTLNKEEYKLRNAALEQKKMEQIIEFCKDSKHQELCNQLKQLYLEAQLERIKQLSNNKAQSTSIY